MVGPGRSGGVSGVPVTLIAPPVACAIMSKLLKPAYGPYVPKPFTWAYTNRGLMAETTS